MMPGEHTRETCPACAGWLDAPPLARCTEPENHARPPGKGFNPPYMKAVAEAVADSPTDDGEEEDDKEEEQERKPPWTS